MKLCYLPLAAFGLASFSCDGAKKLADKARSAVESELAKPSSDAKGSTPDPALQKLVDQTPEGVVFRKDLPFPTQVDVKITRSHEISGRTIESSVLGSTATVVKGTQTSATHLERSGDQVRYTLAQSTFAEALADNAKKDQKPVVRELSPASKPRIFKKAGGNWASENPGEFRAAVLSKELSPVFDLLLEENLLSPRQLWFGKRIKIGTEVPVVGEMLPMLVGGKAKGSYKLKLESISAVGGHPCGVFSVTGDYSRKDFPDFEGNFTDEDVTTQSGKLWLSLLYPIILREELDTIQTYRSGAKGTPSSRTQGTVKVSVIREWKKVES